MGLYNPEARTFSFLPNRVIKTEQEERTMSSYIIIDGNAFYEVDDACMRGKEKEREKLQNREGENGEEKREKREAHRKGD